MKEIETELTILATAELDEQIKKELEVADPGLGIAEEIFNEKSKNNISGK